MGDRPAGSGNRGRGRPEPEGGIVGADRGTGARLAPIPFSPRSMYSEMSKGKKEGPCSSVVVDEARAFEPGNALLCGVHYDRRTRLIGTFNKGFIPLHQIIRDRPSRFGIGQPAPFSVRSVGQVTFVRHVGQSPIYRTTQHITPDPFPATSPRSPRPPGHPPGPARWQSVPVAASKIIYAGRRLSPTTRHPPR